MSAKLKPLQQGLKFPLLFILCATVAIALVAYAPQAFREFWKELTITVTSVAGMFLGLPVTSNGDLMTVSGFEMRIITQCTAIHYIIILSTAMLLYTRHSLVYRITGVLVSSTVLIIANALRLLLTGVIGSISRDAFEVVHDYLWVASFCLLVLGLWVVWVDRRFNLDRTGIVKGLRVFLVCTAVYGLLRLAMPIAGVLIATLSSPLFSMIIGDQFARITSSAGSMLYVHGNGRFMVGFALDIMILALYIGLFISAGDYRVKGVRLFLLGLLLITVAMVLAIAAGGAMNTMVSETASVIFFWTAHGFLLMLALVWRMSISTGDSVTVR